ncbi:hypothetical protein CAL20_02690 [Bordetella genomosp. 4]|uniref:Uncharacterized protein n=1 Tax=Bordetella genomosp. 4 TaxID=463044 RepID=A0A261USH0_9BORD|nr:hypothetical protein CAL21_22160 [Bordetella genomosp. 4]OZI64581.1 hypothetical protein CAL20_02690 [Bordetella genomosp. 4]
MPYDLEIGPNFEQAASPAHGSLDGGSSDAEAGRLFHRAMGHRAVGFWAIREDCVANEIGDNAI